MAGESAIRQAIEIYQDEGLMQLGREGVLFTTKHMITNSNFRVTMPIYVSIRRHIQKLAAKKALKKGYENRLSEVDLRKFKTSNTVFILGSGSTINDITESEWEHINDHDSFGLNFWPIHPHTPTIHVFELPTGEDFKSSYYSLLNHRSGDYSDIPIIIKDIPRTLAHLNLNQYPESLINNTYLAEEIRIPWRDTDYEVFDRSIEWFDNRGYFDSDGRIELGLKKRASVSFLIHMAVKMGYQNIVLCGIDMNNSKYFYNERRDEFNQRGVPMPPVAKVDEDGAHRTNDPSVYRPVFENVLYALNENLLSPKGISLYTESSQSATYPELPLYEKYSD